jgi:lipase maturation factor 1
LIGPTGILPADDYLHVVKATWWDVPTVFWAGAGDTALTIVVVAGLVVSILLTLDIWPRLMVLVATLLFLSCVSVLQDFSAYQSDGMLLEAGVIAVFLAPRGVRPGLGADDPPMRLAVFMLLWEWLRIYFESGVVKLASGDIEWRTLTALDHYYENNPLPTWIGWYVQELTPRVVEHVMCAGILAVELIVPWMMFLPRRGRLLCAAIVTPLQIGIILTANYAFLNYLVLLLGLLLLDDRVFARTGLRVPPVEPVRPPSFGRWVAAGAMAVIWYATVAVVLFPSSVFGWPARALAPYRIANPYGLFATMTTARYEIEFQGTRDGVTWAPYLFRYKPQNPAEAPGIYAPYQPRFEWNLWFASLGNWRDNVWVVATQARLLDNDPAVLALFRANPFPGTPPAQVRTVLWQYWFTSPAERRQTRQWWNRTLLGPYAGAVARSADGRLFLTP